MRLYRKAGERLDAGYAGQTNPCIDAETGELRRAGSFVAALGASSCTCVEAQVSEALVNALAWSGGRTDRNRRLPSQLFGGWRLVAHPETTPLRPRLA